MIAVAAVAFVIGLLAAADEDNQAVLWIGVAGVAILVGLLVRWAIRRRSVELEQERARRRDADWGSRPSDGMEL